MKKTTRPVNVDQNLGVKPKEDKLELQQLLIQLADEKILRKGSDRTLDRENEKIKLLSGEEISIAQIRKAETFVAKIVQKYSPKFPNEFYKETYRLNNWTIPANGIFQHKPPIIGNWTNEIIYARFAKEVLPMLQELNPYIAMGVRVHKHHQWLTPEGQNKLVTVLWEAIEVMKSCERWYEFRVKYSSKYGVSFQLNAFENNENFM